MQISRRRCFRALGAGIAAGALGGQATLSAGAPATEAPAGSKGLRYVRFETGRRRAYGVLDGEVVKVLRGRPYGQQVESGETFRLSEVKLLVPCEPTKVLALAGNYKTHLGEKPVPKNPEPFIKAPSALLEHEGSIRIPPDANDVHYEGELVIVIGKRTKDVSPAQAQGCIFGYTCGDDVSAREWQKNDVQWWRAKACDTFAPLGPWIVTGVDPARLLLQTRVNGEVKQKSSTGELIYQPAELVSFMSKHMTLLPGDVIFTGTPGTTSPIKAGDVVEVEIDGIGVLRNRVA
jgi:2-keto-4-pentenoate hydratase/2-oxohepta-3-ene-1,7-dioic acid hydratase in catechol pathway